MLNLYPDLFMVYFNLEWFGLSSEGWAPLGIYKQDGPFHGAGIDLQYACRAISDLKARGFVKGGQQIAIVQSGRLPIWRSTSTHAIQVGICLTCWDSESSSPLYLHVAARYIHVRNCRSGNGSWILSVSHALNKEQHCNPASFDNLRGSCPGFPTFEPHGMALLLQHIYITYLRCIPYRYSEDCRSCRWDGCLLMPQLRTQIDSWFD